MALGGHFLLGCRLIGKPEDFDSSFTGSSPVALTNSFLAFLD